MRVVVDTNVLVRAAVSPEGPAHDLLQLLVSDESHTLILSAPLLEEVADVLERPYFSGRISEPNREAFRVLLAALCALVSPAAGPPIVENDPADDVVLYTALAGGADVICTRNTRHLDRGPAAHFCVTNGILVMGDIELLGKLRSERSDSE